MAGKEWDYHPLKERFTENAVIGATAVAYGLALSQIFNPVALSVAAAYGIGKTAYGFWQMHQEGATQKLIDKGYLGIPYQARTQKWVDEAAQVMEMTPHKAYRVEDNMIKAVTPWFLRWALDKSPDLKQSMMEKAAFALTTHDLVAMAKEFLDRNPERQERFAIMHEMAHCKAEDSYHSMNVFKLIKKNAVKLLLTATALTTAAGIIGLGAGSALVLAPGVGLFTGALMFAGASVLGHLGIAYASRIAERRADRNAVYLTRDPQAMVDWLKSIDKPSRIEKFTEPFKSHPGLTKRIANLREAANLAAAYPAPATAIDPAIAATSSVEEKPAKTGLWVEPSPSRA